MFRGKLGRWLTPARAVGMTVVLIGLGLFVGGAIGTWASNETETGAAAAATPEVVAPEAPAPETPVAAAPEVPAPAAPEPLRVPKPLTTSEPEPGIQLAPRPDRDRRERRLALNRPAVTPPAPPRAAHNAANVEAHDGQEPAWQRFAAHTPTATGPMIAIVIDDSGHDPAKTQRLADFDQGVLTFAFLPYVERLAEQTEAVRTAGHEILLHLPLEPLNPELDTGPNALTITQSPGEFTERLAWNMARLDGYVGVNNHMGSRFTADRPAMQRLMAALAEQGLLFLDSRTTTATVGESTAAEAGVPFLRRDVFLDNEPDAGHVAQQLREAEAVAQRQGFAVAIGHAHPWTTDAIEAWAPAARARGITLVPLTALLKERTPAANQHASSH